MVRRINRLNRIALIAGSGVASVGLGSCDFTEFTTTVTLDSRQVVEFLVRGAILTPIEEAINQGIDYVFDKLEGEEER
ncbi:MAG: hypothetical protein IT450_06040 [Phycisphaerales bacterium]|nr:hypothetical protein [Phycisphaerales bacterium]